jgi:hypothetical protein
MPGFWKSEGPSAYNDDGLRPLHGAAGALSEAALMHHSNCDYVFCSFFAAFESVMEGCLRIFLPVLFASSSCFMKK